MKNSKALKRSEYLTNRILLVFTIALFGVFFLMYFNRMLLRGDTYLATKYTSYALMTLGGLGVVYGVFRLIRNLRLGVDEGLKTFSSPLVIGFSAMLFLSMLAPNINLTNGLRLMYVVVPVAALLYIVFCVYQREFFFSCFFAAIGAIGFYVVYRFVSSEYTNTGRYLVIAGLILAAAAFVVIELLLRKNNGFAKFLGKRFAVIPDGARYFSIYAMLGVVALGLVAVLIWGAPAAFYMIFAVLGLMFVLAVYYTTKLM